MFVIRKKTLLKILRDLLGKKIDEIPQLLQEAKALIGPAEDISKLKKELKELELKKTMEQREIEHLVRLKEEKLTVEFERKEVGLQKDFQAKEMVMQTQYHDKIMGAIEKARKEQQDTYKEIMKRLPNVNVRLGDKRD